LPQDAQEISSDFLNALAPKDSLKTVKPALHAGQEALVPSSVTSGSWSSIWERHLGHEHFISHLLNGIPRGRAMGSGFGMCAGRITGQNTGQYE